MNIYFRALRRISRRVEFHKVKTKVRSFWVKYNHLKHNLKVCFVFILNSFKIKIESFTQQILTSLAREFEMQIS